MRGSTKPTKSVGVQPASAPTFPNLVVEPVYDPKGTVENNYKKTGYSRSQIGLTDAEKADARKISVAPSQSISSSAPGDMCIVNICEPVGDLGEKKSSDRDIT